MELLDLGKSRSAVGGKSLGLEREKGAFPNISKFTAHL
jgi:hypothetical protein